MDSKRPPEGGRPAVLEETADSLAPLSDAEVRASASSRRAPAVRVVDPELERRPGEADERRHDPEGVRLDDVRPIPGPPQPCIVCGAPAEPSSVGTPTCSIECLGKLDIPVVDQRPYIPHRRRARRVMPPTDGPASVSLAIERLGSCRAVLERHGQRVRGRMAFCPFHENHRTPAMSLYERRGASRATCHSCGWSGGVIDLEAALDVETTTDVIRRWGR